MHMFENMIDRIYHKDSVERVNTNYVDITGGVQQLMCTNKQGGAHGTPGRIT